jgi:hypothetical protein
MAEFRALPFLFHQNYAKHSWHDLEACHEFWKSFYHFLNIVLKTKKIFSFLSNKRRLK